MLRKFLRRSLLAMAVFAIILICIAFMLHEDRPVGTPGPAADALARQMERAVDRDAWETTRAIQWVFAGGHDYVWDRERDYVRLKWRNKVVLLRTANKTGRAWKNDKEVHGEQRDIMLKRAWALWINDSFWLNPVTKFFDPGVERSLVQMKDGRQGLLITYTSGGVTPGDAYLWLMDEAGLPNEWRMWVNIFPVGSIANSWEGWVTLSTGAKISKTHGNRWFDIDLIRSVQGAPNLEALIPGPDPFELLVQ